MEKIKYFNFDVKKIINDINFIKNKKKASRIENSKNKISSLSDSLLIELQNGRFDKMPDDWDKIDANLNDMKSLYNDKFVGSEYYSIIKESQKVCPICGKREVSELDHYYAESIYYTFSVTPHNLVPICKECNKNKLRIDSNSCDFHVFHPYFDEPYKLKYLKLNYTFINGNFTPKIFIMDLPDKAKENEIIKNFELFKLIEFYEFEILKVFEDFKDNVVTLIKGNIEKDKIKELMKIRFESETSADVNSLKNIFYECVIDNFDNFYYFILGKYIFV